jgi:glycosyltransferase involved in cell wall biosynthesis
VSAPRVRILIHALGVDIGGGLRHLRSFLPALAATDPLREYVVLVRQGLEVLALPPNILMREAPAAVSRSWTIRLLYDAFWLPLWVLRRFDAVVTLTNFGPVVAGVPHICFQRNSLYYCGYYRSRLRGTKRLEVAMRRSMVAMAMKHACVIVTPSDAMAAMIRAEMPQIPAERFRTLYHAVSREDMDEPLNPRLREAIEALPGARLVYPSHLAFYKGFAELFELLGCAKRSGIAFSLVLTIDERDDEALVAEYRSHLERLGLTRDVHLLGRVAQRQVGSLYALCDALVFPSLCESFGFPLLEAMAHRVPILASDTDVNREICGEAAVYFDPGDAEQGARALAATLAAAPSLVQHGEKRLASYDWGWARYAREFVELLAINMATP